jgi:hypothetical protein
MICRGIRKETSYRRQNHQKNRAFEAPLSFLTQESSTNNHPSTKANPAKKATQCKAESLPDRI